MSPATQRDVPANSQADIEEENETRTDRLLRIAESAKDAKAEGGTDITRMTKEERRKVLFGR